MQRYHVTCSPFQDILAFRGALSFVKVFAANLRIRMRVRIRTPCQNVTQRRAVKIIIVGAKTQRSKIIDIYEIMKALLPYLYLLTGKNIPQ
jgi:hypothetical protein